MPCRENYALFLRARFVSSCMHVSSCITKRYKPYTCIWKYLYLHCNVYKGVYVCTLPRGIY